MKKSLSLLLAIALVFGMFSASAFAAEEELTLQQKFDALKSAGIFNGYPPNGDPGFERDMTRAEFAKVAVLLLGLDENAAANTFADVPASHWAAGFIGAAAQAGLVNGVGLNKFLPNGKITIEQVAKILVESLKLGEASATVGGTQSDWAKGYVAAAVQAGLIKEQTNWKANAKRDLLVSAAHTVHAQTSVTVTGHTIIDNKTVEVTFSTGEKVTVNLDTALETGKATTIQATYKGVAYPVVVTLQGLAATAAQTGAKKVTVTFGRALTAAEKADLTYELKYSFTSYPVTATYAEDNKSVVLSAAYLAAGDYTLTVKGQNPINLKIEAERAAKLDITAPALSKDNNISLGVKLLNQFNEEMTGSPQITAYNVTQSKTVAVSSGNGGTVNLKDDAVAKVGDSINVQAVYPSAGLSANKTLKVVNGSLATSIKIDAVQPLTGKTRISKNETGLVLPITLTDANGQAIKLPVTPAVTLTDANRTVEIGGLFFYVSDPAIVNGLTVDSTGKVTFNTGAKAGTAFITVTNPSTGANASVSIVVADDSVVKDLVLSHPGKIIVKGEEVVFPFQAVDIFGAAIEGKNLKLDGRVQFAGVPLETGYPKVNAKGELVFKFTQTGNYTLYTYVAGLQQANGVQITVEDTAKITAVQGVKDIATTFEIGASREFDADNITVVDNFGRTSTVGASVYSVASSDSSVVAWEGSKNLVAKKAGSATITVSGTGANAGITEYKFTVTVIATADVKTYEIQTIGTVYGKPAPADVTKYAVTVKLNGKTASGTTVALADDVASFVTSSNEAVLAANGSRVEGKAAGTSTVSAWKNNTKVAEQAVTVSEAAPVATTAKFIATEYKTTIAGTVATAIEVKDQYGVVISPSVRYYSTDTAVATVHETTGVVTGVAKGVATITLVTSNGTTATTSVVVE